MSRDGLSDRRCDENTNCFNNEKAMPEIQTLGSGALLNWQKVWHPAEADWLSSFYRFKDGFMEIILRLGCEDFQ